MDTNQVYEVLDRAQKSFEELSSTLRQVVGQMKDMAEENQRLHDANQRLTEENNKQREGVSSLSNELWEARREAREAKQSDELGKGTIFGLENALKAAQDECVKLREIILNVASLADPVVNPKAPEVAKAPESYNPPAYDQSAVHSANEPRF